MTNLPSTVNITDPKKDQNQGLTNNGAYTIKAKANFHSLFPNIYVNTISHQRLDY